MDSRIPKGVRDLNEQVLYEICVRLLKDAQSHKSVRDWLSEEYGLSNATREWPRACLARAYEERLLTISPREDLRLGCDLGKGRPFECRIAASEDPDLLPELAAQEVASLIDSVNYTIAEQERPDRSIHIGLSAGRTGGAFAKHLASILELKDSLPQLVFHALTSGFNPERPETMPAVTLGKFSRLRPEPKYVVLLSEPFVDTRDVASVRRKRFQRDAFEAAKHLDIVVTSISVANHEHSLFTYAVDKKNRRNLLHKGWVGDIMWRPYSGTAALLTCDVEAVCVIGYSDLVKLSQSEHKHVVCIAGPCAECDKPQPKTAALRPFMQPGVKTPFDRLVTTAETAKALLED